MGRLATATLPGRLATALLQPDRRRAAALIQPERRRATVFFGQRLATVQLPTFPADVAALGSNEFAEWGVQFAETAWNFGD